MRLPVVCLVTDRRATGGRPLDEVAAEAAVGGVSLVQLREKDLPTRELLDLARRLRAVLDPLGVPLVVNARVDVAFAANAAGVHLPADGLPVSGARAVLGDERVVGRSVHSADEAVAVGTEGADYVILGTVFASTSHPGGATVGLDAVHRAAAAAVPVIGIGGISAMNAGDVIAAGAQGVAVISAILAAPDPRDAARQLAGAVNDAWRAVQPGTSGTKMVAG